ARSRERSQRRSCQTPSRKSGADFVDSLEDLAQHAPFDVRRREAQKPGGGRRDVHESDAFESDAGPHAGASGDEARRHARMRRQVAVLPPEPETISEPRQPEPIANPGAAESAKAALG